MTLARGPPGTTGRRARVKGSTASTRTYEYVALASATRMTT
jgi:hypothetical protein